MMLNRDDMTDEELRVLTCVTVRKPTVWERRAFCAGRNLAIESLPTYAERDAPELAAAKAERRIMTFNPLADVVSAITERTAPGLNPPHSSYRPITAAECYQLAGRSWMPAAASEALVRAARTIEALEAAGLEHD